MRAGGLCLLVGQGWKEVDCVKVFVVSTGMEG